MRHNLFLGVLLTLLAALFYSLQTAVIKLEVSHLPPLPVVIFIQSLTSLLLLLPFIFKKGLPHAKKTLATKKLKLHLLRTLFSLSISYLLFYAVSFIPLVNGLLLANTGPLFLPFIGYLFLSEKINHRLWVPIIIGYIGVAILLNPDARLFHPASLLALVAAVSMASTMLAIRRLSATESTETTAFYFFLFSTIASGLIAIKFWTSFSPLMLAIMVLIGLLYFLCQFSSTSALKYANAQLVSALFYSNVIYAAVLSFFLWHSVPTLGTLLGMAFIIVGGILCIRVEKKSQQAKLQLIEGSRTC